MSEWKKYILKDILAEKGYIRGPFGSALKRADMLSEGIPVYEQQNAIYNNREFRYFINDEKFIEMKRFKVQTDDLIVSCSGTVGKVSIIKNDDEKGIISQALLLLRVNKKIVLPLYLKYFFTSTKGYNAIVERSNGSVQVNISKRNVIEQIPLNLPSVSDQNKIISSLKGIDDKIELNNKINDNLEQQAQAIFKSWFVDFEPFGGVMPSDWEVGTTSDFYDISIGKTPPRKEPQWFSVNTNDVVWISIADMGKSGTYISNSSEYLVAEAIEKYNVQVIPNNTVILSFKLTVGRVAITNGVSTTNEAIAHFKRKDDETTEYLYCYLKNFDYQTLGSTSSIATAVNSKTIKAMPFVMPSKNVIQDFNNVVQPLFASLRNNLVEIDRLSQLRDALLPRLMSGEIDVSQVEI